MKKMIAGLAVLLLVLFVFVGCSASSRSFVTTAKNFQINKKYENVIVYIDSPDYATRVSIEDMFLELVKDSKTKFIAYHNISTPLEPLGTQGLADFVKKNKIDAIVSTTYYGTKTQSTTFAMPLLDVQRSHMSGSVGTQQVNLSGTTMGTQYVPVTSLVAHVANSVKIFDIKTAKDVWYSEMTTYGDSQNAIVKSALKKMYEDLYASNLFDINSFPKSKTKSIKK